MLIHEQRIAQMTERQHRRLAAHYKRRHEQMAKTVANTPRHTVIDYHTIWKKYRAHKKAVDNAVLQREADAFKAIQKMAQEAQDVCQSR